MKEEPTQAYKALREYWRSLDYSPPAGAPCEVIKTFEATYGLKFPIDFFCFLVDCDASESGHSNAFDRECISFWSFAEVQKRFVELHGNASPHDPNSGTSGLSIPFADYMYECWSFDICVAGSNIGEVSAVLTQGIDGVWRPTVLASSFTEFVGLYVRGAFDGSGRL